MRTTVWRKPSPTRSRCAHTTMQRRHSPLLNPAVVRLRCDKCAWQVWRNQLQHKVGAKSMMLSRDRRRTSRPFRFCLDAGQADILPCWSCLGPIWTHTILYISAKFTLLPEELRALMAHPASLTGTQNSCYCCRSWCATRRRKQRSCGPSATPSAQRSQARCSLPALQSGKP